MSKQPPPAPTASAIGPCPTIIQNVGRPGTGSLPRTIAPPDHPLQTIFHLYRTARVDSRRQTRNNKKKENSQTGPTRTYCKHSRPLPYYHRKTEIAYETLSIKLGHSRSKMAIYITMLELRENHDHDAKV